MTVSSGNKNLLISTYLENSNLKIWLARSMIRMPFPYPQFLSSNFPRSPIPLNAITCVHEYDGAGQGWGNGAIVPVSVPKGPISRIPLFYRTCLYFTAGNGTGTDKGTMKREP